MCHLTCEPFLPSSRLCFMCCGKSPEIPSDAWLLASKTARDWEKVEMLRWSWDEYSNVIFLYGMMHKKGHSVVDLLWCRSKRLRFSCKCSFKMKAGMLESLFRESYRCLFLLSRSIKMKPYEGFGFWMTRHIVPKAYWPFYVALLSPCSPISQISIFLYTVERCGQYILNTKLGGFGMTWWQIRTECKFSCVVFLLCCAV